MNIIIAGDGEVGMHLAEALEHGDHNITIVDPHEELLKMIESQSDLMTIIGDSTSIKVLQQANVKKADLVIAALHDEHINLLTLFFYCTIYRHAKTHHYNTEINDINSYLTERYRLRHQIVFK